MIDVNERVHPRNDYILVERLPPEDQTRGGIIIPEVAKVPPCKARVVAIGPGKLLVDGRVIPISLCEGDVVILAKWSGTEIEDIEKNSYLLVHDHEVLATVTEPKGEVVLDVPPVPPAWRDAGES